MQEQHTQLQLRFQQHVIDIVQCQSDHEGFNSHYQISARCLVDETKTIRQSLQQYALLIIQDRYQTLYRHVFIDALRIETKAAQGTAVQLQLVAPLLSLKKIILQRVYHQTSLKKLMFDVLQENGVATHRLIWSVTDNISLSHGTPCYQQSVLELFDNLCQRYGLVYFYQQNKNDWQIVITDDVTRFKNKSITHHGATLTQRLTAAKKQVQLSAFQAQQQTLFLQSNRHQHPSGLNAVSFFDHMPCADQHDLEKQCHRLQQQFATQQVSYAITLDNITSDINDLIYLTDCHKDWPKQYRLIHIKRYFDHQSPPLLAHSECHLMAADCVYRSKANTDVKFFSGFHQATILSHDDKPDLDKLGFYRLRFDYDQQPDDTNNQWRIPAIMPFSATKTSGMQFPYPPGTKVLVTYCYGDLYFPIIVGRINEDLTSVDHVLQTPSDHCMIFQDHTTTPNITLKNKYAQQSIQLLHCQDNALFHLASEQGNILLNGCYPLHISSHDVLTSATQQHIAAKQSIIINSQQSDWYAGNSIHLDAQHDARWQTQQQHLQLNAATSITINSQHQQHHSSKQAIQWQAKQIHLSSKHGLTLLSDQQITLQCQGQQIEINANSIIFKGKQIKINAKKLTIDSDTALN